MTRLLIPLALLGMAACGTGGGFNCVEANRPGYYECLNGTHLACVDENGGDVDYSACE